MSGADVDVNACVGDNRVVVAEDYADSVIQCVVLVHVF